MRRSNSRKKALPTPVPIKVSAWLMAMGLIVVATIVAYSNSFGGSFVFDDEQAVLTNPSIAHLTDLGTVLSPPAQLTVGGRPLLNLSFAINYAMSGLDVWSYHAFNLLIHLLAAVTLFGVLFRTLQQPLLRGRFGADALPLATAVTALWALHPLQTESVSYISQRAESIMGLFYLLTLYAFIRYAETKPHRVAWAIGSVAACALGLSTKETMITAPVIVLIYDRTFLAGTFRQALKRRWPFYIALAASWLVLLPSFLSVQHRVIGTGYGVSTGQYVLTEIPAILHYMRLTLWPYPLIFDYGMDVISDPWQVMPQAILLAAILTAVIIAFIRWPLWGFAGAWFFGLLAPTSSFIVLALSPVAEHRLYLPIVAVLTLLVLGGYLLLQKRIFWIVPVIAIAYGSLTWLRNEDYRTDVGLWGLTAQQLPLNARAHSNHGGLLYENGHNQEALQELETAARLKPDYIEAHNNFGVVLLAEKRLDDAAAQFSIVLQLNPNFAPARNNLGNVLTEAHRYPEAAVQYQLALQLNPRYAEAYNGLGVAYDHLSKRDAAIEQFSKALQANPGYTPARDNLNRLEGTSP